jgi:hypothetical protein
MRLAYARIRVCRCGVRILVLFAVLNSSPRSPALDKCGAKPLWLLLASWVSLGVFVSTRLPPPLRHRQWVMPMAPSLRLKRPHGLIALLACDPYFRHITAPAAASIVQEVRLLNELLNVNRRFNCRALLAHEPGKVIQGNRAAFEPSKCPNGLLGPRSQDAIYSADIVATI